MPLRSVERFRNISKGFGLSSWNSPRQCSLLIAHQRPGGEESRKKGLQRTQMASRGFSPSSLSSGPHSAEYVSSAWSVQKASVSAVLTWIYREWEGHLHLMSGTLLPKHTNSYLSHTNLTLLSKFGSTKLCKSLLLKVGDTWQHHITRNLVPNPLIYIYIYNSTYALHKLELTVCIL